MLEKSFYFLIVWAFDSSSSFRSIFFMSVAPFIATTTVTTIYHKMVAKQKMVQNKYFIMEVLLKNAV